MSSTNFRKPMLCDKATIEQAKDLPSDLWVVEQKYDGVRAMIVGGKLIDRRGKDITKQFPEFEGIADYFTPNMVLDGEVIAQSGEFNDVSGRVHLRDAFQIKLLSRRSPARLMLFDAPFVVGTLEERRAHLETLELPEWAHVAQQYPLAAIGGLWRDVLRNGDEGLVVKHKHSFYEWACRSPRWLKVKAFVETTASFTKFEVHNKGITIETDDGRRVVINGKQADEVVQRFKSNGKILAEIQYLPQRDSEAWRFPSFRGIVEEGEQKVEE